jgi:hypothetical protein
MAIAAFTHFFCQSPELFRLSSGSLCRHAVVFRQPTVRLGSPTAVVGLRGLLLCLLALLLRRSVFVIHEIHLRQRTSYAERGMSFKAHRDMRAIEQT